ncbi:MAG: hypothetical protein K4571_12085 [Deltaproteobacteria bacterium]
MDFTGMIRQILDFNKKAFDDNFTAVVAVQEHTEKMVRVFRETSVFFPEEGKKVIADWAGTYKNGLNEFKANVDMRFKQAEEYLLTAADQMELSPNTFIRRTETKAPADDQAAKKVATGIKKAVTRKPADRKKKPGRKKTDKP